MSEPVSNPSDTSYDFASAQAAFLSSQAAPAAVEAAPAPQAPVEAAEPAPQQQPDAVIPDADSSALEKLMRGEEVELPKEEAKGDDLTEWENPKSRKAWADARAEIKRLRAERQEFENQRRELEGKIPKDYEEILKERDTYRNQLAATDLTKSPEFQNEIERPLHGLYSEFKKVAEQFKINEYTFGEALNTPDELERNRKLSALFEGMDDPPPITYTARIALKADQLHELLNMREQMLQNAPDILSEMDKRRAEEEQAKQAQERELYGQASKMALQTMERTIPLFKGEEGKALMEAVKGEMSKDLSTLKPAQKALALAAPVLVQAFLKAQKGHQEALTAKEKEVASLKLQLQKLSGASPGIQPSSPSAPSSNGEYSFEKAQAEALAGAFGRR